MSRLIREGAITLMSRAIVLVLGLAYGVLLARALGPEELGSFRIITATLSIATLLVTFGLGSANVFFGAKNPGLLPALFGNSLVASTLGFMAVGASQLLLFIPVIANYYRELHLPIGLVRAMLFLIPLQLVSQLVIQLTRAAGNVFLFNLYAIAFASLNVITLLFALSLLGDPLQGALIATAGTIGFGAVASFIFARRVITKLRPNFALFRETLRYGLKLHFGNLAQFLNYRADLFIVAAFLPPREVGFYALATSVGEKLWETPEVLRTVMLFHVASRDQAGARQMTARVSRLAAVFLLFLAAFLGLLAYPLVKALYGAAFLSAVPALLALLPGVCAVGISKIWATHLAGRGKPLLPTYAACVSLVMTVILDFTLIPRIGIVGAAIASSVAYTTAAVIIGGALIHHEQLRVAQLLVPNRADLKLVGKSLMDAISRKSAGVSR